MRKLFILLFAVSILVFAVSCSRFFESEDECAVCMDLNNDQKCDRCEKIIPSDKENGDKHTECADTDENGLCDVCGLPLLPKEEHDDEHTECADTDENGLCDVCGLPLLPKVEPDDEHKECADTDENGFCDGCGNAVTATEKLSLIKSGEANFYLVLADGLPSAARKSVDNLKRLMRGLGAEISVFDDGETTPDDAVAVLIGEVTSFGEECRVDAREYGYGGYAARIINEKVVLVGSNDDSICKAIAYFTNDILKVTETTKRLSDADFTSAAQIEFYFDDYRIESLTVGGRDIADYVIAVDSRDIIANSLAISVRDLIFRYAGYNLKITRLGESSEKHIEIKHTERSGGEGFYVYADGESLKVYSEFPNKTLEAGEDYFKKLLAFGKGKVEIYDYTANTRDISYSQFGAVGNGYTDDSEAIRQTHDHANKYGYTVVADPNATYYIGKLKSPINIMTNVVWGDAKFIIDDRNIHYDDPERTVSIFQIVSSNTGYTRTPENSDVIREINENGGIVAAKTKKLDLGFGFAARLIVFNANHKSYIRTGGSWNDGADQQEIIIVDENGNIDESTPFMFDYSEITSILIMRIDEEPITVDGGVFVTRAMQYGNSHNYYSRNIVINRPNVTLKNLYHEIVDELPGTNDGCPYSGFISIWSTVNITIENCTFSSHKTYSVINGHGNLVNMGSYDLSLQRSHNVIFKNCDQTNFFSEDGITPYYAHERWGVMGSNYCKNVRYENCKLSRFDAHSGIYNATLKNCETVYISVVGAGSLLVEDSIIYNDSAVSLRGDYGAFWLGDIIFKNVTLNNIADATFFNLTWTNHYYGYETALPKNLILDNFKLRFGDTVTLFPEKFANYGNISLDYILGEKNLNPMSPLGKITIRNNVEDIKFVLPDTVYFRNTEMTFE